MEAKEIINVLTNGVGKKPYYRRNNKTNEVDVFVADDQKICSIPTYEPDNNPEEMAKAICEAGLMLKQVKKYARHKKGCNLVGPDLRLKCTCGFEQALKGL